MVALNQLDAANKWGQLFRRAGGYRRMAGAAVSAAISNIAQVEDSRDLLPAEVDEHPAEVLGVLLDPVVQRLDVLAVEEPQHVLLELT